MLRCFGKVGKWTSLALSVNLLTITLYQFLLSWATLNIVPLSVMVTRVDIFINKDALGSLDVILVQFI